MTVRLAALFVDLDNTLHDYERAAGQARSRLAAWIGGRTGFTAEVVLEAYQAAALAETARASTGAEHRRRRMARLCEGLAVELDPDELAQVLAEALNQAASPFEGAVEAFERLSERYRVILFTEGYPDIQAALAAAIGLRSGRLEMFATYGHGQSKRDGGAYGAGLRRFGLSADATAMVGDNWDWDIRAAAAEGLRQLWISHGRPAPGVAPPGFLGTVESFRDVPALLQGVAP